MAISRNSIDIEASQETLYSAFINPTALEAWMAPSDMTAKVHNFDLRIGGRYTMSLFYPPLQAGKAGKTGAKEDRYFARFMELTPYTRIVEAITFDTTDEAFSGEMLMEVTFKKTGNRTRVTIVFNNIPTGIRPEDNETGTQLSLEKLAQYVG